MQTYQAVNPVLMEEAEADRKSLFFQTLLSKFFVLWPWIIGSIIICLAGVFLYFEFSSPEYKIHATILVQDDKKGSQFGDPGLLQDFGLLPGKSNVDNEAEILKSRTVIEEVVQGLGLNVTYAIPGRFKATEVYSQTPVTMKFVGPIADSLSAATQYTFKLNPTDLRSYTMYDNDSDKTYKGRLNDTLALKEGKVLIETAVGFTKWAPDQSLNIMINPFEMVIQNYMKALSVDIPNKQVSIINLTFNQTLPEKGERILNRLIKEYMQGNLDDKNRIADSTIRFIDDRLTLVLTELTGIEKDIQGFKTVNKLTDITEQSKILLQSTSDYAKQQTGQEVQLLVVQELEDFLKNSHNSSGIVPSSLIVQDPSFIATIQRYNEAQIQREKMLMSLTASHPSVLSMDQQIQNLRMDMLSSIGSIKRGIQTGLNEIKKHTSNFDKEISSVPEKERMFLDYSRQQAIKQELYLFLLKKREETAITKTSNMANSRIIDKAKADNLPYKPKKAIILIAGLMLGFIFPFAISLGKDAITNRINTLKDITDNTHVQVLAEIGHNKEENGHIVVNHSRNLVAEQFRALRTNLQYLLTGKNDKTIMVTSSMGGEGKSFLSVNLCTVIALAGKKVLLMELDLRKPKITENLKLQKKGFTNYLISNNDDWQKWVQKSGIHENFDVFPAGPIPPNPTELLLLPQTAALFKSVKQHYDYIVLDTPPAGMVTDAEIVGGYADVTLYMVRHHTTYKEQISLIERFHQKKSLPRINIIVNDVEFKKAGYGNGYGYGYGYGDYGKDSKK
jgi:tyrosine-protein kinase Etk/Wzc